MLDLKKLTPAPWEWFEENQAHVFEGEQIWRFGVWDARQMPICMTPISGGFCEDKPTNVEFIAIARNAFDIMLRRGWHSILQDDGNWLVMEDFHKSLFQTPTLKPFIAADPFTALVEADKWYKENVENAAAS